MLTKNAITYITDNEARDISYKEGEALGNFINQDLDSTTVIKATNGTHKLMKGSINTLGEKTNIYLEQSVKELIIDTNKIICDD